MLLATTLKSAIESSNKRNKFLTSIEKRAANEESKRYSNLSDSSKKLAFNWLQNASISKKTMTQKKERRKSKKAMMSPLGPPKSLIQRSTVSPTLLSEMA